MNTWRIGGSDYRKLAGDVYSGCHGNQLQSNSSRSNLVLLTSVYHMFLFLPLMLLDLHIQFLTTGVIMTS
jgi:hypothetical protein